MAEPKTIDIAAEVRRLAEPVMLPAEVEKDDQRRRDGLFLVLTVVTVGVNLAIMIGVGWEKSQGTLWVYSIAMVLALCNLAARWWLDVPLAITSNIFVGMVYLTLTAVTLGTGGIGLAAPFALAVVPMLAILLGTLRASIIWTVLALAVPAVLAFLHAYDFHFPLAPDPGAMQKRFLVSMAGIVVLLCLLSLLFDWLSRSALRDLSRVHGELNVARVEAQAANLTKTRFLANMSHEIRTPMNGVLNMLDLLRDGQLSDGQRRSVDIAHRSAQALLHLLNDIVDLAKVEAGAINLEHRPFSLERTAREVLEFFSLSAGGKGIELVFAKDDGAPDGVVGDGFRLRQVLVNLVGNALKFTPRGRVTLRLASAADGGVLIAVSDTGIGIGAEHLDRIFDPFTQADASSTRRHGGTGLGLAISRQLVEQMKGSLTAESVFGEGSTFTVRLPLARVDHVPEPEQGPTGRETFPGARVLIVEDNAINRMVAQKLLARAEITTEVAGDGRVGVDMTLKGDFDLVLMDCQMPEMDGYDATAALRRVGYDRPIVALTANAMEGDREKCLAAGMDDFLTKPLRREALLAALHRWLPPTPIVTRPGRDPSGPLPGLGAWSGSRPPEAMPPVSADELL
ncbi:MAG: ATP-binding protein [bacterium]|nr:response regulator [Myxococcales bacterium]